MEKVGNVYFEKLSAKNYNHWSFKMKMLLDKEGCWDPIEKEKHANVTEADWLALDKKALFTIVMCLENNQLTHVKKATTSKEAWKALKSYHQNSSLTGKIGLTKKLFKAQLPIGGNMEQHLQQITDWIDELTDLGDELEDKIVIRIILSSLNEQYDGLITALEVREEDELKLEFVKAKLIEEWEKKTKKPDEKLPGTAFKVAKSDNSKKTCYFCKKRRPFSQ